MNWIFQGNPKEFNVNGYLTAFNRVAWTIRQSHYKDQIEIGDRVFFWRSKGGQKGPYGVIAVGKIASKPMVMPDHTEALQYWVGKTEEDVALRCWVDVTHSAISIGKLLPIEDIAGDELLKNLRILRLRQNTNYLISDEEGKRLFALYGKVTQGKSAFSSFSWTIEGSNLATKMLDKSTFLHHGSGIPKDIRWFFLDRGLGPGERFDVMLFIDGEAYPAHIAMESQGTARTRLFWDVHFTSRLHQSFPYHLQQYQQDQEPSNQLVMHFERRDGLKSYNVMLGAKLSDSEVAKDIEAERVEEAGPRNEGGVREYYGKRYERNALNRKRAIEYHGLTCNACGFNFEKAYGAQGTGYIEVHHVRPISTFGGEQQVDPKADLVTLCSNCHRIIHRTPDQVMTIHELKHVLEANKSKL